MLNVLKMASSKLVVRIVGRDEIDTLMVDKDGEDDCFEQWIMMTTDELVGWLDVDKNAATTGGSVAPKHDVAISF